MSSNSNEWIDAKWFENNQVEAILTIFGELLSENIMSKADGDEDPIPKKLTDLYSCVVDLNVVEDVEEFEEFMKKFEEVLPESWSLNSKNDAYWLS
jgi:hypothetical protein